MWYGGVVCGVVIWTAEGVLVLVLADGYVQRVGQGATRKADAGAQTTHHTTTLPQKHTTTLPHYHNYKYQRSLHQPYHHLEAINHQTPNANTKWYLV
jgi:hypothetical protein